MPRSIRLPDAPMPVRIPSLLLSLLVVVLLSGCFYSREIAHTRRDIERAARVDLDRSMVVSVGPFSLRTIGWLAGFVPDEEVKRARAYLRDVRRVKIGVYDAAGGFSLEAVDPSRLPRFERRGWQVAVHFREEGQLGWVLFREHRDTVRDLYVVVLDEEELVLARVQGRLNRLLARLVEDHGVLTRLDRGMD